jgi:lipoprotein-anchoring transpeptidase ErfK/SrfK
MPAVSGTTPAVSGTAAFVSGTAATPAPTPPSPYSIEIDLEHQRTYLLKNGQKVAEAPISSGRPGHLTPTGDFAVIEKDLNHFSNLYGKIVEKGSGAVVKSGADVATPIPKGCKFVPAPMKWFMRFEGASGMHAGILPGYPASHGCVRMPASKAQLFYETVEVGTPVHVFGTAPERSEEPPHRHAASTVASAKSAAPTPKATPTPKPRHGWWPF